MPKWYGMDKWTDDPKSIREYEFVRETDQFLVEKMPNGKERRVAKSSDWMTYYPNRKVALEILFKRLTDRVGTLEGKLTASKRYLEATKTALEKESQDA